MSDQEFPTVPGSNGEDGPDSEPGFERLRAADPAADAQPNLAAIRSRADEAIGTGAGGTVTSLRRTRRTRTVWLAAASVGVVALLGGGFLAGRQLTPSATTAATELNTTALGDPYVAPAPVAPAPSGAGVAPADPAPAGGPLPPISLGGSGDNSGGGWAGRQGESSMAAAPAAKAPALAGGGTAAQDMASSSYWGPGWGSGRTVFHDGGVSGGGGTGKGYAFDPSGVVNAESASRLAKALGVKGEPKEMPGYWLVGDEKGIAANLNLSADGLASFWFYDPAAELQDCSKMREWEQGQKGAAGSMPAEAPDSSIGVPAPAPGGGEPPACVDREVGPAPRGDAAVARIKDLLTSLGFNPADFQIDLMADQGTDARMTWGSADRLIDGQRTGATWGFSFVGDQLSSMNGSLAPVVPLGDYPVITAAQAIERLNDVRFGAQNINYPVDYQWPDGIVAEPKGAKAPTLPAAGAALSWPVTEEAITSARLGTAMQHQPNGSVLMVPAYELKNAAGISWSVIAVADEALNFAAPK